MLRLTGKAWPPTQPSQGPSPIDSVDRVGESEQTIGTPTTTPHNSHKSTSQQHTTHGRSIKKRETSGKVISFDDIRQLAESLQSCVLDEETGEVVRVKKESGVRVAETDDLLTDVFWAVNNVFLSHAAGTTPISRESVRNARIKAASEESVKKEREIWDCNMRHSEGHPRPHKTEQQRLMYVMSNGLKDLTVKEGLLYDSEGKYNQFFTEILSVIDYGILDLAVNHDDGFAWELVRSMPHLAQIHNEIVEEGSLNAYLRKLHSEDVGLFFTPETAARKKAAFDRKRREIDGASEEEDEYDPDNQDDSRCSDEIRVEMMMPIPYSQYKSGREEYDWMYEEQFEEERKLEKAKKEEEGKKAKEKEKEKAKESEKPKDHNLMVVDGKKNKKERMIVQDSGSSRDIACSTAILGNLRDIAPVSLITGNGESVVNQKGDARLTRIDGNGKPVLVKKEMLYDPRVPVNIVSTGSMDHIHHRSVIHQNGQLLILKHPIRIKESDVIVRGRMTPGMLYRWDTEFDKPLNINERFDPKPKAKTG